MERGVLVRVPLFLFFVSWLAQSDEDRAGFFYYPGIAFY